MSALSDRIKEIRGNQSQAEFAKFLGVSTRTLGHYESGERYPNSETLELLCRERGVSGHWLLTGEGPMQTQARAKDEGKYCPKCSELQEDLRQERQMNRELVSENRQLWKENGFLREQLAETKARAAPDAPLNNTAQTA